MNIILGKIKYISAIILETALAAIKFIPLIFLWLFLEFFITLGKLELLLIPQEDKF